jgi:hypothetical protein
MSLTSWLENWVGGSSANTNKGLNALSAQGNAAYGSGTGIADQGIAGINDSIGNYQAMLKSGKVLPPNVYRAYDLARGAVQDNAARDIGANAAGLKQQALAAGGTLSPEAQAEYNNISTRTVQNQAFDATNAVDTSQAGAEQAGATDLMNRVDSLKNTILNAGQFRQSLGQQTQYQALMARINRANDIAQSMSKAW